MPTDLNIRVHSVADDGYPDMEALTGRVAFIWDGSIVSGWPLHIDPQDYFTPYSGQWEPDDDRFGGPVAGVTHWVEFPEPIWNIGRAARA